LINGGNSGFVSAREHKKFFVTASSNVSKILETGIKARHAARTVLD
jgi:hypothetical protein